MKATQIGVLRKLKQKLMANCKGKNLIPQDTYNTKPTKPHRTWEQAIENRIGVKQPDGSIRYVKKEKE